MFQPYSFELTPGGFPLVRMDDSSRPFATFLTVVAMQDPAELQEVIDRLENVLAGSSGCERIDADDCQIEIDGDHYVVRASRFNPFMHKTQTAEMSLDQFRELITGWRDFIARQRSKGILEVSSTP